MWARAKEVGEEENPVLLRLLPSQILPSQLEILDHTHRGTADTTRRCITPKQGGRVSGWSQSDQQIRPGGVPPQNRWVGVVGGVSQSGTADTTRRCISPKQVGGGSRWSQSLKGTADTTRRGITPKQVGGVSWWSQSDHTH